VAALILGALLLFGGSGESTVPELSGLTIEQARARLDEEGLELGAVSLQPGPVGSVAGTVFAQEPLAGVEVGGGSRVNVTVASTTGATAPPAEATTTAPSLLGLTQAEAEQAVQDGGFILADTISVYHSVFPAGQVAGQVPSAGQPLPVGGNIAIAVSMGAAPAGTDLLTVPGVLGTPSSDAATRLQGLGFVVVVWEQAVEGQAAGVVVGQCPGDSAQMSPGGTVIILVSSAVAPAPTPTLAPAVGDGEHAPGSGGGGEIPVAHRRLCDVAEVDEVGEGRLIDLREEARLAEPVDRRVDVRERESDEQVDAERAEHRLGAHLIMADETAHDHHGRHERECRLEAPRYRRRLLEGAGEHVHERRGGPHADDEGRQPHDPRPDHGGLEGDEQRERLHDDLEREDEPAVRRHDSDRERQHYQHEDDAVAVAGSDPLPQPVTASRRSRRARAGRVASPLPACLPFAVHAGMFAARGGEPAGSVASENAGVLLRRMARG
jgi:beta-lactam-binding protein with PASTA domain